MKSVLARANFEHADLSDALMDRSVIVDANLRNAILQVGAGGPRWAAPRLGCVVLVFAAPRRRALCSCVQQRLKWNQQRCRETITSPCNPPSPAPPPPPAPKRVVLTRSDLARSDIFGADFTNALVDRSQQLVSLGSVETPAAGS